MKKMYQNPQTESLLLQGSVMMLDTVSPVIEEPDFGDFPFEPGKWPVTP